MKKISLLCLFLTLPFQSLHADTVDQHGEVDFQTSCTEKAQEAFETGLALLHHMMYQEAEKRFEAAAKADSECAMAYWGIAMTNIHPLWGQPPSEIAFDKAHQATQKAQSAVHRKAKEEAYVKTIARVFERDQQKQYTQQLKTFEQGYKALHEMYPEDIDAAAFYALGHLATVDKGDTTLTQQKQAGKLLEELRKKAPAHPAVFHYTIHAYDHPRLAERAVEIARAYDKLAPEVAHALHMPTHIFVRQGQWQEVIDWNKRSAEVALKSPVNGDTSLHYMHALDYLTYAYLQQGQIEKAQEVLADLKAVDSYQPSFASSYAIAAIPARLAIEQGDWKHATQLDLPVREKVDWDKFPHAAANIFYAKGVGAARSGNLEVAKQTEKELNDAQQKLEAMGEGYWAKLAKAQKDAVSAWIAWQKGDKQQALQLMETAAKQEDALDKHPVTPGSVIPARELLGDMYLKLGKPELALQAYQTSLELSPNRTRSLLGAVSAAQATGEVDQVKTYFAQVQDNFRDADLDYVLKKQAEEMTSAGP